MNAITRFRRFLREIGIEMRDPKLSELGLKIGDKAIWTTEGHNDEWVRANIEINGKRPGPVTGIITAEWDHFTRSGERFVGLQTDDGPKVASTYYLKAAL